MMLCCSFCGSATAADEYDEEENYLSDDVYLYEEESEDYLEPWNRLMFNFNDRLYFLVIKPQKEKQNQHQQMLNNLKKNDEIVTSGGIHATIVNIKEDTVTIRIDDNVKVEIDRSAVLRVTKI